MGAVERRAALVRAASTPARRPPKSPAARTAAVLSEGRYMVTADRAGALTISWEPDGADGGGGAITLPPMIARLIERAGNGEQISPAMVLRAMRG